MPRKFESDDDTQSKYSQIAAMVKTQQNRNSTGERTTLIRAHGFARVDSIASARRRERNFFIERA